jgi:lipopolysaccharide export system protein LptA
VIAFALLCPLRGVALPQDADQPIQIEAESAEIDQNTRRLTYIGSVQVDQGTLKVTADRMVVDYEERDNTRTVTRITATGKPAYYEQQLQEGEGAVRANARTIVYHTVDERIEHDGDAHLVQQGNAISGNVLHYDVVAGRVDAASTPDAPVKMTLQADSARRPPKP